MSAELATSLIFLALVSSCGKTESSPVDVTPFVKEYSVTGENLGKRVFLIHGLGGNANTFETSPELRALKYGLVNMGLQVVTFTLPEPSREIFNLGGLDYRIAYRRYVGWLINDANLKLGPAAKVIFGGVSFGGLHALMATALSYEVDGYFAVVPVTDPAALTEFSGLETKYFNPLREMRSIGRPGHIVYGAADSRVNSGLTMELIHGLLLHRHPLTFEELPGHGHATTMEVVQKTLSALDLLKEAV